MYQPSGGACMKGRPLTAAALAAVVLVLAATCPASAQAPPEEGAVRLVAREDINGFATGALQVFVGGQWGSVCTDRFDDRDADVACRQLGFVAGVEAGEGLFFRALLAASGADMAQIIEAPFVLENLGCSGDEATILDCPPQAISDRSQDGDRGCTPFEETYAFVACGATTGPEEGSVRLADGAEAAGGDAQFGRLEVFFKGGWGTVCVDDEDYYLTPASPFSLPSARVVCRQLGFAEAFVQPPGQPDTNGSLARVPIWLAGAACDGNEDTLTSCPGVTLDNFSERCRHSQDLSILCFNPDNANPGMDGSLRLQDGESGTAFEYGRLEIFLRGLWSNICSTVAFTPDAAQVACKALGFDGGASLEFPQAFRSEQSEVLLGEGLPVALAEVDCDGSEASLLDCSSSDGAISLCGRDNTVLACINTVAECDSEPMEEQGALRLIDGVGSPCDPMHTGIVEIFNEGRWGAVCTTFTGNAINADVVCRQLGFPQGTPVDGLGRDYSDNEESDVASDTVWLSGVLCRGPEATLAECLDDPADYFAQDFTDGTASCSQRLHVACRQFAVDEALEQPEPVAAEGAARLVDERTIANWALGDLEVFVGGSWRQVCAAGFDDKGANVACRQLGYGAGTIGPFFDVPRPGTNALVFPDVGVTLPGCNGTEATLLDCGTADRDLPFFTNFRENFGCKDSRNPSLTLACVVSEEPGEEGALRLVGGEVNDDVAFGVPQIFHAGAWGTFCDGDDNRYDYFEGSQYLGIETFTDAAAVLACVELGFSSGFFRFADDATPASDLLPPWVGTAFCGEEDTRLSECSRLTFGDTASCGLTLQLICSNAAARLLDGEVRLVGGQADPGGAWEYGRLELRDRGVFVRLFDLNFGEALGRRGAQVACRQLGYAAGAEVIIGENSALPGPAGVTDGVSAVRCEGEEEKLGDCQVFRQSAFSACSAEDACNIALLCSNPSDCTVPDGDPQTGDVRLVPLADTDTPTAACDAVHFGGVEIFNAGRWGAVCVGGGAQEEFTLDAQIVCRQLGFPFGRMYDITETPGGYYDNYPFPSGDLLPSDFAWASEVVCTGPEARLDDCLFTESPDNTLAALPEAGVDCFRILGVVCSQFDLVDTAVSPPMSTPAPAPMPAPMPAPPPAPVPKPSPAPVPKPSPAPLPTPTTRPPPPGKQPGGRPPRPRRQRRSPPARERRPARLGPPPGAAAGPPRTKRPRRMAVRGWTPGRVHKESRTLLAR